MFTKKHHKNTERGQGLVEYALILGLVALVVVATLALMGDGVGVVYTKGISNLRCYGYINDLASDEELIYKYTDDACYSVTSATYMTAFKAFYKGDTSAGSGDITLLGAGNGF